MKKLIKLALVAIIGLSLVGCAPKEDEVVYNNALEEIIGTGKITMVTSPDYAPYEFIDPSKSGQEQYVGADIELGKYIAEKLGVELKIEALDFDSVLASINTGKADFAISGISYTDERAETMDFTTIYSNSENSCSGILVNKENADLYQTIADFNGKKIGAQNGTVQMAHAEDQITDAVMELVSNINDGVLNVKTNKVDGFAIACSSGEAFAQANDDVIMATPKFIVGGDSDGNAATVTKGEVELLEKINEIIAEVLDLGLYSKWEQEATEYALAIGAE